MPTIRSRFAPVALFVLFTAITALVAPSPVGYASQKSTLVRICSELLNVQSTDQSTIAKLKRKALRNIELGPFGFAKKGLKFIKSSTVARFALKDVQKNGLGIRIEGNAPVIHNRGGTITLGDDILFEAPVTPTYFAVENGASLSIGSDTYLNDGVWIGATKSVTIGARVKIGPGVRILDNTYHDIYIRSQLPEAKPVVIEDDVWIASDSIVMPGVRIGRGAIVGAHSLVNKDVAPFTIVAGNPARLIRELDPEKFVLPLK